MCHIIRCAKPSKKGGALLQGIIEADETYIGGKPRKPNKKADAEPVKRGRGTEKTAILGTVEREGKVVSKGRKRTNGKKHFSIYSECCGYEGLRVDDG